MCKCTPGIRTPFCGKIGCEWPKSEGTRPVLELDIDVMTLLLEYREENFLKSLRGDPWAEALVRRIDDILRRFK